MNLRLLGLPLLVGCFPSLVLASAADQPVEVPFEFVHQAILVGVKVNGRNLTAMFDTGVDPSGVDLETAQEIGLKVGKEGVQATGGGSDKNLVYETRFPQVELGALAARDVATLAVDLSKTSAALGRPIHVILGYSFQQGRIVQIDYPHRVLRFFSESPISAQPDSLTRVTLRFRYQDEILVEDAGVNGKKITANIDTGSNSTFQLTPPAVTMLGLESQVGEAKASQSVGINGVTVNHEGSVDRITLGTLAIAHPKVVFYGRHTGHDGEAWGIRVGNAFLKDYLVTIDYPHGTLTLEKR